MTRYDGRNQPPVTQPDDLTGAWWRNTPRYVGRGQAPTVIAVAPAPAPCATDAAPPGARSIAIMIPRALTEADPKR